MLFNEISCLWWNVLLHTYNVILNKEKSHTTFPITNLKSYQKKLFAIFSEYIFFNTVSNTISAIGFNCSKRLFFKRAMYK